MYRTGCHKITNFLWVFLPFFRSVYDNDLQQQFLSKLDERIKSHDKEIERMCNFHYQGFVESVNELIKVRSDARTLKVHITSLCFQNHSVSVLKQWFILAEIQFYLTLKTRIGEHLLMRDRAEPMHCKVGWALLFIVIIYPGYMPCIHLLHDFASILGSPAH